MNSMNGLINLMLEIWQAFVSGETPFLYYALLMGILASVAFGVMGTMVVAKRISYLAGAISHCVLGGIGAGLYFNIEKGITWITPFGGAVVAAVLAAILIGLVGIYAKEREDTIIGAVWSFGMSVGLLFIAKTSGYVDPMSYLFGNILITAESDLMPVMILDAVIVGTAIIFYRKFLAICFDEEFSRLRGIRTTFYYLLMLVLIALTVVLLATTVGIVLVIALLTLPPAIAGHLKYSKKLWQMMIWSVVLCMFFNVSGLALSYATNLPSGPTIIVLASLVYFFLLFLGKIKR